MIIYDGLQIQEGDYDAPVGDEALRLLSLRRNEANQLLTMLGAILPDVLGIPEIADGEIANVSQPSGYRQARHTGILNAPVAA